MTDQELAFATACSQGFDAGNYANAYDSTDLDLAIESAEIDPDVDPSRPGYRHAFILGFFASYALHEIPGEYRDEYDQAYHSAAGQHCAAAGYLDSREDEYAGEIAEYENERTACAAYLKDQE